MLTAVCLLSAFPFARCRDIVYTKHILMHLHLLLEACTPFEWSGREMEREEESIDMPT